MQNDSHQSYSFSLQLKLCQDIRYFKQTTKGHSLNTIIDEFILNFIKGEISYPIDNIQRGRPTQNKSIEKLNKYIPYQFSLKVSTVIQIKLYKEKGNNPNLDGNIEEHLKLIVPIRDIR